VCGRSNFRETSLKLRLWRARLTLSSKKDCYYYYYYYTSSEGCTCKAGTYGRICRHMKTLEEHDRNLYKMPASYGRMVRMAREEAESEPL
jgi:hypothetical protein